MADYTLGDTIYKRFTTRQFSTGAPFTLAGTPVVSAYEDDSATQITVGITLEVDHDTVTGLNLLTIVATGGNGFEAGKSYDLVITTGTVDSVSVVGETVWHFTLGAEAAFKRLGAPVTSTISADIAVADGNIDSILTDTGTTIPATITTLQADTDDIQTRLPAALVSGAMNSNVSGIQAGVIAAATFAAGALDAVWSTAVRVLTAATNITSTGGTTVPQTGDSFPRLGAPAGASVSADIAAVKGETATIGVAGAGLTDLGGMSTGMKAEVESECNDALVGQGLDHLLAAAVVGADVTDNSIMAKLVSSSALADWDDFVNTSDSLQAIRDFVATLATSAEVAAVQADTDDIQTRLPAALVGGAMNSDVSAMQAGVITVTQAPTLDANISTRATPAQVNTEVGDVIRVDTITDSVPADGSLPTIEQGIYMISQFLQERAVSGTSVTVKKVDGATTLMTFTLDDGTTPTSITRTT